MPRIGLTLLGDFLHWHTPGMRSHTRLAAETFFLRKQLAFYAERGSSRAVLTTPVLRKSVRGHGLARRAERSGEF